MKQVIPFYKEIVFKNNIASLTSISLEHNEVVKDGEVSGEFIVFGDYKVHNDTTEKEEFKYKLPFTALIPDDVDLSTVVIDIANFKYEQIDADVLRIDIDFSIEGECTKVEEDTTQLERLDYVDEQIDEILNIQDDVVEVVEPVTEEVREEETMLVESPVEVKETTIVEEKCDEYVTYHVHVVSSTDSVESIIKLYNTNMDVLTLYNDIKELKVGDKVLIPEYLDE